LQLREEARLRRNHNASAFDWGRFERAERKKLLRMLAALGMTEQEYRAFLTRLHDADAKREEAAKIKEARKNCESQSSRSRKALLPR
jgi:acyl-CoA reductase-like NAD-dependent aldehyde dehydrogenase